MKISKVLDIPNIRQETPDTCGPAAVRAILGYYGVDITEKELVKLMNVDPRWGAEPEEMAKVMRDFGLKVQIKSGMSIDDLRMLTNSGVPTIVVLQAWGEADDYSNDWDDSHYVVVKSVTDLVVMFEDPATYSESQLSIEEFEDRWHGWDEDIVSWGMIVRPGKLNVDPIHRWIEKMGESSYKMMEHDKMSKIVIEVCFEENGLNEAKYRGRTVTLNKPMKGDVKKSKVYVKKPNGKVVKVNFGDPNMRIKKHNKKRRKSFRARHNCDNPGPKWKARYWSCRAW